MVLKLSFGCCFNFWCFHSVIYAQTENVTYCFPLLILYSLIILSSLHPPFLFPLHPILFIFAAFFSFLLPFLISSFFSLFITPSSIFPPFIHPAILLHAFTSSLFHSLFHFLSIRHHLFFIFYHLFSFCLPISYPSFHQPPPLHPDILLAYFHHPLLYSRLSVVSCIHPLFHLSVHVILPPSIVSSSLIPPSSHFHPAHFYSVSFLHPLCETDTTEENCSLVLTP